MRAVGFGELRPGWRWFQGTSLHTTTPAPPPNFRHASSGARSFSKLTAQSICAENSQHRASARRDTRPTGQDPEAVRLAHSFGKALTGNGKTLAVNPMKPVRNGLV